MTPANTFEGLVEDWLAAASASTVVPADLHGVVVDRARRTRQRRPGLRFLRRPAITDSARLAIDLAAVVVLAVGAVIVLSPLRSGGGQATDSRSASPSPSAGGATPSETLGVHPFGGDYTLGRHSLTVDGFTFSFAIEAVGWEPYDGFLISKSIVRGQAAEGVIFWAAYPNSLKASSCVDLSRPVVVQASQVVDLVASRRGLDVVAGPSEVTIGGRSAYRVSVIVREDEGCDPGYVYNWKANTGGALWTSTRVGDTITVWVVDVEGRILVIGGLLSADTEPNPATQLGGEIEAIVASMRFE